MRLEIILAERVINKICGTLQMVASEGWGQVGALAILTMTSTLELEMQGLLLESCRWGWSASPQHPFTAGRQVSS